MSPSHYSGLGELLKDDNSLGKYHCTISVHRNFGSNRDGSQYEKLPRLDGTMILGNDWHKFFNDMGETYVLKLDNGEKFNVFFKDLGEIAPIAVNEYSG